MLLANFPHKCLQASPRHVKKLNTIVDGQNLNPMANNLPAKVRCWLTLKNNCCALYNLRQNLNLLANFLLAKSQMLVHPQKKKCCALYNPWGAFIFYSNPALVIKGLYPFPYKNAPILVSRLLPAYWNISRLSDLLHCHG